MVLIFIQLPSVSFTQHEFLSISAILTVHEPHTTTSNFIVAPSFITFGIFLARAKKEITYHLTEKKEAWNNQASSFIKKFASLNVLWIHWIHYHN